MTTPFFGIAPKKPIPTFDQILPAIQQWRQGKLFDGLMDQDGDWLLINRDLNGRVRLILPERIEESDQRWLWKDLAAELMCCLGPHAYPPDQAILYEASIEDACQGGMRWKLEGFENTWVVDRLATEGDWASIVEEAQGVPRIVFFSIKGGVGRSTALAASAWGLARQGKRVLVLDLDLESPGLSSALLPADRHPKYGITDWLVEDLVNHGDALINDLYATSDLPVAGAIYLVPAHGSDPGEYVSKLGRVWMPKLNEQRLHEGWPSRLNRLVNQLEAELRPDVILIDSRAGIDEVAAACVTHLGAQTILMFAIQGQQTWTGYRALFTHWQQRGVIREIRNRLQLVAGLVPDDERRLEYLATLRADAYGLFEDTYDAVEPGAVGDWSFEEDDDNAPHAPLPIRWNRGWYGLLSLQQRMAQVDENEVKAVYGALLDFLDRALIQEGRT
jgi:hypothetical protein